MTSFLDSLARIILLTVISAPVVIGCIVVGGLFARAF